MIEINKQTIVTVSMDIGTLDQLRDALVIAIDKGPMDSVKRYTNLLTEIDQAYVKED